MPSSQPRWVKTPLTPADVARLRIADASIAKALDSEIAQRLEQCRLIFLHLGTTHGVSMLLWQTRILPTFIDNVMAYCADALFGKIASPNIIVPFSLAANLPQEDRAAHAECFFLGICALIPVMHPDVSTEAGRQRYAGACRAVANLLVD